jgi:hypothetical protein
MQIAVQIVSIATGIVAAQQCGWIGDEQEMEAKLSPKLLSSYQRLRTVQADHPSVNDFRLRVADIQAGMDARIMAPFTA